MQRASVQQTSVGALAAAHAVARGLVIELTEWLPGCSRSASVGFWRRRTAGAPLAWSLFVAW